jgi:geranylgeranyl pyrophosphate synthase
MNGGPSLDGPSGDVIAALGFSSEIESLRLRIGNWVESCDEEMRPELRWQFLSGSKYFRPLTIFACYRSLQEGPLPAAILTSALVIELFHNMTLVIDDILDHSPQRRGRATLHRQFGDLDALMASGYIVAEGYRQLGEDTGAIALFSELMRRLAVAESMQWRLRRQLLGVEDWRRIAGEDTGSMFEICACLGDRSERLRRFGGLLGLLYHGCDDVGDVRGATALGGGGVEDLRDGILTLPAALAIRDPAIGALFSNPDPSPQDLQTMATCFADQLPEAEAYLDRIAAEARSEAQQFCSDPRPLLALIDQTRQLSGR